jgi:hypothetical protein
MLSHSRNRVLMAALLSLIGISCGHHRGHCRGTVAGACDVAAQGCQGGAVACSTCRQTRHGRSGQSPYGCGAKAPACACAKPAACTPVPAAAPVLPPGGASPAKPLVLPPGAPVPAVSSQPLDPNPGKTIPIDVPEVPETVQAADPPAPLPQELHPVPAAPPVIPAPAPVAAAPRGELLGTPTRAAHYDHAADFSYVVGELQYLESRRQWRLRYTPHDVEDPFGGVVVLRGAEAAPDQLKPGRTVRIKGQLVRPDATKPAPEYQVYEVSAE